MFWLTGIRQFLCEIASCIYIYIYIYITRQASLIGMPHLTAVEGQFCEKKVGLPEPCGDDRRAWVYIYILLNASQGARGQWDPQTQFQHGSGQAREGPGKLEESRRGPGKSWEA